VGVVRILVAKRSPLSLPEALERSVSLFAGSPKAADGNRTELLAALRDFYAQRMYAMLRGDGADHDLVAAILASPWEYPHAVADMVAELAALRKSGELAPFVLAMKRVTNIIPRPMREGFTYDGGMKTLEALAAGRLSELGISPELFDVDAEKKLAGEVSRASRDLLEAKRAGQVQRALSILRRIVPYVNKFFEDVLVNCEDEKMRDNRIAFLASSYRAFMLFCDFSQIAGE
jgi:glycyl-tRNA synthetase beta chain